MFYSNIKIAIRAARTKTTVDYLKTALCDCEGFDKQKVISCTLTGSENLLKYLSSVHAYDCNKAIERYKQNPTEFEKFVENKLIADRKRPDQVQVFCLRRDPQFLLQFPQSRLLKAFAGRDMPYFECSNAIEIQDKALELIAKDEYDVISIHTFEYDNAAHAYGPESKEAINAVAIEAEGFHRLAEALEPTRGAHRTLLTYSPDHGQHLTAGGTGAHGSACIEDMNILHFFGTIA